MGSDPRILKVARLFTRQHKMNIVSMVNVHNAGVGNEGVVYEKDYIYPKFGSWMLIVAV